MDLIVKFTVSKPIIKFLGEPENIKFVIRGKGIVVTRLFNFYFKLQIDT